MSSLFNKSISSTAEKEHPSQRLRIDSSEHLFDRGFTTDFSEEIPERGRSNGQRGFTRGLTRSKGQRGFTLERKDKRRRWNIFRKTKERLFQKDRDDKIKIKNNVSMSSLQDETEGSSSVSPSYQDALAELDYFDDLDVDIVVLNEHASSLRNLNTETLSHPNTDKRLNLLAATDLIRSKIHNDYTEVLLDHSSLDQCDFDIPVHLLAANHLVQEFLAEQVQDLIRSVFMPDTIQEAIFCVVEDYIQPRIANLYSNSESATPADAAKICCLFDRHGEPVPGIGANACVEGGLRKLGGALSQSRRSSRNEGTDPT